MRQAAVLFADSPVPVLPVEMLVDGGRQLLPGSGNKCQGYGGIVAVHPGLSGLHVNSVSTAEKTEHALIVCRQGVSLALSGGEEVVSLRNLGIVDVGPIGRDRLASQRGATLAVAAATYKYEKNNSSKRMSQHTLVSESRQMSFVAVL